MKQFAALLLCLSLALGMTACRRNNMTPGTTATRPMGTAGTAATDRQENTGSTGPMEESTQGTKGTEMTRATEEGQGAGSPGQEATGGEGTGDRSAARGRIAGPERSSAYGQGR